MMSEKTTSLKPLRDYNKCDSGCDYGNPSEVFLLFAAVLNYHKCGK